MVYDMGSLSSLRTLRAFVEKFPLDSLPIQPVVTLVAAKADDEDAREVSRDLVRTWSDEVFGGAPCYEVSAREDPDSVSAVFLDMCERIREHASTASIDVATSSPMLARAEPSDCRTS